MALVRFDPFEEIRALQNDFFGNDAWPSSSLVHAQLAATDIYTDEKNQLVIEAHLPHFDQKDVEVNVDKGILEVRAEKHEKEEDKKKKYVVRESSTSFYRRIRLPEHADTSKISAHMENGVLKVIAPFKQLPRPKKIMIGSDKPKKTK